MDQAKAAGADFIVAPGFNPAVVKRCQELGLPVVPGCITPTEIEAGLALGLTTFKFFPSEAMNGMATIKQLCGQMCIRDSARLALTFPSAFNQTIHARRCTP